MTPTPASLRNGKASFRDAAERLPRKEPDKAFGALFVDVNAPAGLSSPAINKTTARQSRGGTGAQNRGCPHPGTPATLHSGMSNTFFFFSPSFLRFPGFEDYGLRSAAAPEAKASRPGYFSSAAAFSKLCD